MDWAVVDIYDLEKLIDGGTEKKTSEGEREAGFIL